MSVFARERGRRRKEYEKEVKERKRRSLPRKREKWIERERGKTRNKV